MLRSNSARVAAVVGTFGLALTAWGQTTPPPSGGNGGGIPTPPPFPAPVPVQHSQSGSAIGARRPGRLVETGLQHASDFTHSAFAGSPEVVDPPHSTIKQQALAQSLQTIFQNLNLF